MEACHIKGLVKYALGLEGVELRELPEPIPREGELKVKVLAASICGSDIHTINDERSVAMPVVMGHEYVGQVVETCGDTGGIEKGSWVVTLPACYSCGTCGLCRAGLVTLCSQRKSIGSHVNGAMADYLVVPAKYSFAIPRENRSLEDMKLYALTEPLACIVRGVYEKIDVKPGDTVVISGPGVMGQMAAQVFKTKGAYVILSGLAGDREKLELAKSLGSADVTVTSIQDLREAVFQRNPEGADITCEATGLIPSLGACTEVIRPLGTHLQIGMFGGKVLFRMDSFFDKEIAYIPSNSTALSSWETTLRLLREDRITLQPFMSMQKPLAQWQEAFDAVIRKTVFKAVLLPNGTFEETTVSQLPIFV